MEQWAADIAAPGEQFEVRCLAQGSHLSRGHFLPEPGFEPTTLGYLEFQVQRSNHYAGSEFVSLGRVQTNTLQVTNAIEIWLCKLVKQFASNFINDLQHYLIIN